MQMFCQLYHVEEVVFLTHCCSLEDKDSIYLTGLTSVFFLFFKSTYIL